MLCKWHPMLHGLWGSCLKNLWVWKGQYSYCGFSLERKQQCLGTRVQCPDSVDGKSACLILMEPWPSDYNLRQVFVGGRCSNFRIPPDG